MLYCIGNLPLAFFGSKVGFLETWHKEGVEMGKHIQTLTAGALKDTVALGGCGSCQSSCQSACKTSCTVGNQECAK